MQTAVAIIREALDVYIAGKPAEALALLKHLPAADPLPDHEGWNATECERRAASPSSPGVVSAAVRDWLELARDRMRSELGIPGPPAVVPVPLALRTALEVVCARFLDPTATDNDQDRLASIREAVDRLTILEHDVTAMGDELARWRPYLEGEPAGDS